MKGKDGPVAKRKIQSDGLPLCLKERFWKNGGRYFINKFPNSENAMKDKLNEEYRTAKKPILESANVAKPWKIELYRNEIKRVKTALTSQDLSLFEASFMNGKVTAEVMADQFADTNLKLLRIMMWVWKPQPTWLLPSFIHHAYTKAYRAIPAWHVKISSLCYYSKDTPWAQFAFANILWKVLQEDISCPIFV